MQYRFEKLYDYSCKLLPFSRETLRKEPSQFREKQQNSSAVKAFSHYKIMSVFINETKNITTVPSKCVENKITFLLTNTKSRRNLLNSETSQFLIIKKYRY